MRFRLVRMRFECIGAVFGSEHTVVLHEQQEPGDGKRRPLMYDLANNPDSIFASVIRYVKLDPNPYSLQNRCGQWTPSVMLMIKLLVIKLTILVIKKLINLELTVLVTILTLIWVTILVTIWSLPSGADSFFSSLFLT